MSCTQNANITPTPEHPEITSPPKSTATVVADPLWDSATYTDDTELGDGSKTITVLVQAGEKTVKFTVKTDAETLGDALTQVNLITGSQGPYGLMVEKVNGIQAIYQTDNAYWGLYSKGEYSMTGADTTPISDGDQYEWVYTKA